MFPYTPDAIVDEKKTGIGYEVSFARYFFKEIEMRPLSEIVSDLRKIEAETDGLIADIMEEIIND